MKKDILDLIHNILEHYKNKSKELEQSLQYPPHKKAAVEVKQDINVLSKLYSRLESFQAIPETINQALIKFMVEEVEPIFNRWKNRQKPMRNAMGPQAHNEALEQRKLYLGQFKTLLVTLNEKNLVEVDNATTKSAKLILNKYINNSDSYSNWPTIPEHTKSITEHVSSIFQSMKKISDRFS